MKLKKFFLMSLCNKNEKLSYVNRNMLNAPYK